MLPHITNPRISEEADIPAEGTIFKDSHLIKMIPTVTSASTHYQHNITINNSNPPDVHINKETILAPSSLDSASTSTKPLATNAILGSAIESALPDSLTRAAPITVKDERKIEQHLGKNADAGIYDIAQSVTTKDEKALGHLPPQQTSVYHPATTSGSTIHQTTTTIPVVESMVYRQQTPHTIIAPVVNSTTNQIPLTQSTVLNRQEVIGTESHGLPVGRATTTSVVNETLSGRHLDDSMRADNEREGPEYMSHWSQQQSQLSGMRYENHQAFENWEANRNLFVNDRLNIMNDLLEGMERTLKWLDIGVEKVILFFKEREAQEFEQSKAVKHGLTQVGEHFEKWAHPEVLESLTRGLKENDAFHARESRSGEIMGMFIRKDILDWILLPAEKNYKQQAAALRLPLLSHKKKMEHLGAKRQRAYHKHFKLYDTIQKMGKSSTKEDNLFQRQLKYSLAAREELRMLRLYCEQGLLVIGEFAKLSALRMSEVQRCFTLYLQKYTELYQNTGNTLEPILELISMSNKPEAVSNLFSVRNLLSANNHEFLSKALNNYGELVYSDLNPFLLNFPESVDPARSSFVLREFEAVKMGNLLKKPRACSVVATTNNNLLIVERKHEEREIGKVKDPMQMRFTKVEEVSATEDGTIVKVVERTPGTLYTHTSKANLKFETQEEAQQFMQFVNSQTSGEV